MPWGHDMLKLRRHPDQTWTTRYKDEYLDKKEFTKIDRVSFSKEKDSSLYFRSDQAVIRIKFCSPEIVRISFSPDGKMPFDSLYAENNGPYGIVKYQWKGCKYIKKKLKNGLLISTGKLRVVVNYRPFQIVIKDGRGKKLLSSVPNGFSYKSNNKSYKTLSFFNLDKKDQYFGFGGRIHKPNRRGSTADMFSIKVWLERGDYGGFPLPYFLNPKGYGFVLDNPWPHVYFDMGREFLDRWFLYTPNGFCDFYILAGPRFSDIAKNYCQLTGYPALPPKWLLGFWVSWCSGYTKVEEYVEIAERLRKEKWPFDVMVVDMFWRGGQLNLRMEAEKGKGNNLEWDLRHFGDGTELIKTLHENNAKICLHLNTSMFTDDVLKEGLEKGFLRKEREDVIVPRVTDKKATEWYKNLHRPRTEEEVDLWWTDNGERVDGELSAGLPSRNLFGHIWNKTLFDHMEEMGHKNRLVLSRGGWYGAQRFTLTWPGDTGTGVDRLQEDLWWNINCSVSGIPYNTVDFGGLVEWYYKDITEVTDLEKGYSTEHGRENIIRRVANGMLLFPVARIHGSPKLPWQYHKDVQAIYRFFLELRYRLFPYLYSYVIHCVKTGAPIYRPLVWHHQEDAEAYRIDTQVYFGDWLLLAPVLKNGFEEWEVYLPEGDWIDFWTLKEYKGKHRVLVDAPLLEPSGLPLFIKKGAVIPMRPLCQYNKDGPEDDLRLHLFPAPKGSQTIYEGMDSFLTIRHRVEKKKLRVEINNSSSSKKTIYLIIHGLILKEGEKWVDKDKDILYPFDSGQVVRMAIPPSSKKVLSLSIPVFPL